MKEGLMYSYIMLKYLKLRLNSMNKDIAKKWVEALRSGEYSQTRGILADDRGFCCLGVLCELYIEETKDNIKDCITATHTKYDGNDCLPPVKVLQWSGLQTALGTFKESEITKEDDPHTYLAGLNDVYEYNFNQIADVIEANVDTL